MSIQNTILFALEIVVFASYIYCLKFWFKQPSGKKPIGLTLIDITGIFITTSHLYASYNYINTSIIWFSSGFGIIIISYVIFLLTLYQFKNAPPAVAFSNKLESELIITGTFKYTRNPFYLSYLLTYLGGSIATGKFILLITFLVMLIIYWKAIKKEEQILLNSDQSDIYKGYYLKVPRFLPIFPRFINIIKLELKTEKDLIIFKDNYEKLANSSIPYEYLKRNKVIGFYGKGGLIGGFVIGTTEPFRTIETFSSPNYHENLIPEDYRKNNLAEVCCFWLKRKLNVFETNLVWQNMSKEIKLTHKPFFLGGTFSRGLAKIYDVPTHAFLIHLETFKSMKSWIFISKSDKSNYSALQVVIYKIMKGMKLTNKKEPRNIVEFENVLNKYGKR